MRPAELTATELLSAYAAKSLSPVEVVNDCLLRIDEWQPAVNAVFARTRRQCSRRGRGQRASVDDGTARPLEGVPYGLKDIVETAGVRTTGGSLLFDDHHPAASATVHTRLEAAGAVLLAKLAHE